MDITGMDKAVVLAALYNASQPLGMGFMHAESRPMSVEEARDLLKEQTYFDYLKGRVMKVDLSGDDLRTAVYDRDNGKGAAEYAITMAIANSANHRG